MASKDVRGCWEKLHDSSHRTEVTEGPTPERVESVIAMPGLLASSSLISGISCGQW